MDETGIIFNNVEILEKHITDTNNKSVILFAKFSNATLYTQNSFIRYLYKVKIHNDTIAKIVEKHGGKIVEHICNNAIMCEFNCTNNNIVHEAINAAIEIIEEFEKYNNQFEDELEKVQTGIGLAFGKVVYFYNNHPQGLIVELASRIQYNTKPNQILIHKDLKDSCDVTKIHSCIGDVLKYKCDDYFSEEVSLKMRGFSKIQKVIEVKAIDTFKGIKSEYEYAEYWKNYRFEAYLSNFESSTNYSDYIKNNYFRIVYDLRYETVLTKANLKFVCTTSQEQFNRAMKDNSLFSRYNLPNNPKFAEDISNLFIAEFVEVDGIPLDVVESSDSASDNYYYYQCFSHELLKAKIGQSVSIRYRITTIINKYAHFFYMTTEYPIQKLSMVFKSGDTDIQRLWLVTHFVSESIPKITYNPSQKNAKEIEVAIGNNEWVYPGNGVTFVWRLNSEGVPEELNLDLKEKQQISNTGNITKIVIGGVTNTMESQHIDQINGGNNQINYKSTASNQSINNNSAVNDYSEYLAQIEKLIEDDEIRKQQFESLKKELEENSVKKDRKTFWEGVFSFGKHAAEIVAIIVKIFESAS